MKEFLIKIDPRSIKENKPKMILGHRTTTTQKAVQVEGEWKIEVYVNGILTSVRYEQIVDWLNPNSLNWTKVEQPCHYLYDINAPKYSYSYLPTQVECNNCGKCFPHTELKETDNDWDMYIYSFERVCPHCHTWDCCQLIYERLFTAELEKLMAKPINQVVIE